MKNATKVASKFVVQVAHLLEVDRGGAPHFSAFRPLAVAAPLAAGIVAAAHALELTAIWFAPVLGIAFLLAAYLLGAVKRDDILWLMKR